MKQKMLTKSSIIPVGPRLLVKIENIEEVSEGGIVLSKSQVDREELGQVRGEVVAMGSTCFKHLGSTEIQVQKDTLLEIKLLSQEWCKVGDTIIFQRYAGMKIPDERSEKGFVKDLLLINDNDVIALIKE